MTKVYAVINGKGGVGKTTTAVHMAAFLSTKGPTLLIDADPKPTAAVWAAWRRDCTILPPEAKSPTTVRLLGRAVYDEGKQLKGSYDYVVVDVGAQDTTSGRNALLLADEAILPIGASDFDTASLEDTTQLIEMVKGFNEHLKVTALATRIDTKTRDAEDLINFLVDSEIKVFTNMVCERKAYRKATGLGMAVWELPSRYEGKKVRDKVAAEEILKVLNEVVQ
ncbi:AAA family ATPase [Pseudomonas sp. PS02302]|jgi:chromosome partitioning protein|uniref:AAA family ATPase n=1 Tax=Pseudomonas sp. PS02302 TaxID=2991428 RepID=UPI00249A7D96|nr:AAA family ATPase [Pseudomonas sp. PS02302]